MRYWDLFIVVQTPDMRLLRWPRGVPVRADYQYVGPCTPEYWNIRRAEECFSAGPVIVG